MTRVEISLDLDIKDFDQRSRSLLQHGLAGLLRIPAECVQVKSVSAGSVRIVVLLPEVEAEQLIRAYEVKDRNLSEHLAPFCLLGIRRDFLDRVVKGTKSAAYELNQRYRQRLCALVARELDRRLQGREDPEDIAQSTLRSVFRFLRNASEGQVHFDHEGALWKLIEKIARRKILKHGEHHRAQKRDPNREAGPADEQAPFPEPTPEDAAAYADIVEQVLQDLDPIYAEILQLRLAGHSERKIAEQLGISREAVHFRLRRLGDRLTRLLELGTEE